MAKYIQHLKSIRVWAHGLIAAIIGGAANSVVVIMVDPVNFNFEGGLGRLKLIAMWGAVFHAAAYLTKSPIWKEEDQ